ncbi:MAG: sulfatase [Planctomycetota bacterium]|nr:sulfatase [Planctomycetota bacterium]
MRQALLLLLVVALILVVPRLLPQDEPKGPGEPPRRTSEVYAADGTYILGSAPEIQPRNLILLLLDTVNRDAVGFGDEPARDMPNLRALAKRGVAFREAATVAPWTIPTVASVLTGLLPTEHGCRTDGPAPRLLESIVTYAEALRTTFGFQTAAFSDVPWYRGSSWSILQGFEAGSAGQGLQVRPRRPMDSGFWLHGGIEILTPWIEGLDPKRPYMLFLHTYDAHDPYGEENHPPAILPMIQDQQAYAEAVAAVGDTTQMEPWEILRLVLTSQAGRRALIQQRGAQILHEGTRYAWQGYRQAPRPDLAEELRAKYTAGVRWTDEGVGKLIAGLEAKGMLENTLFVVFSDHGEAFGEHGLIGHGRQLDEELIHVPLVMHGPGPFAGPKVVDGSVSVVDIMPTFMDWIGAPDLARTRGRSLLPLLRGEAEGHPATAQARVVPETTATDDKRLLEAVRDERWKYIVEYDINRGAIEERLFDLDADPGERTNLLAGGKPLHAHALSKAFCAAVEASRDRIWEAADGIRERGFTAYSAGVPTTEQKRPAPCGGPEAAGR